MQEFIVVVMMAMTITTIAATLIIIIIIIMLSMTCLVVCFNLYIAIQKSLMGILGIFYLLVGSLC
jgi:hypothetical protein